MAKRAARAFGSVGVATITLNVVTHVWLYLKNGGFVVEGVEHAVPISEQIEAVRRGKA